MIDTIAPAPVGFSWVNYDSTSIVTRDDEDVSIIKSHAMRVVHRERHKNARETGISPKKKLAAICRPKGGSADSMMWKSRRNPFLYEPEQLRTDWESLAICAFMDDFVYPQVSPDTAYQFLNFLPGLYNRYSQSSSLTKAISAVALARFANQKQAAGLASLAHKAYTSALTTVNESMKDPILRRSDNFLTTLILLTKYEMVCGDALVDDTWQLHDRGQAALILQRGDDYLRTEIGGALFRLIYTRQCLNCIARRHKPTISMTSGSWQLAFPTAYFRKTMKLVASIADLVYDAYSHSPPCGTAPNESCRVADDAVRMDAELTAFMTQILPCMEYDRIPNDVHREKDFEEGYSPKSLNIFRDLQLASLHHIFWYGRLHVLQIILQYSNYQLKWQREELQARLQETVDHICESVPYALGDTDCPKVTLNAKGGKAVAAHYLVWVLAAASIAPGVPIAQKEWISQRLKHIGHVHGLQQALVFA
jgi:hypothetical protein